MKEIALQKAAGAGAQGLGILREYLQNEILFVLQRSGISDALYFVGGTALRFLYGMERFSEDIDFCAGPAWRRRSLQAAAKRLESDLKKAGYGVELALKEEKTVQRVFVCFSEILQEARLSRRAGQKLSVNVEIDTRPPAGWVEERTIVNLHLPVLLRHYDKASLWASKIAAFLTRPYTKGRDVYDLVWLRSRWPDLEPNLVLLNNALARKGATSQHLERETWPGAVAAKARELDWDDVVRDIRPFLADPRQESLLTRENLLLLFGGSGT